MTTMTRLPHTSSLHSLLQSVSDSKVVHHSGCDAWTVGWSWVDGHMTDQTNSDADSLWHAGLISFNPPVRPGGNVAVLTFEGSTRLSEWTERYPKGGAE